MSQPQPQRKVSTSLTEQGASQPLVLTDWTTNVERISTDRDTLLWELLLHSLLRDKILIQDEALAQSAKLARWFHNDEDFRLLEELIDTGLFMVITQDPKTYPSNELRDLAYASPIEARAKYILRYGAKHGKHFRLPEAQQEFHRNLDAALRRKRATRPRAQGAGKSIHHLFRDNLLRVLRDEECRIWLQSSFRLNPRLRNELAAYVESPETVLTRIVARGSRDFKLDPRFSRDPLFTRTLAHYLARTYSPSQERAINSLIHSAYAAAFCNTEGDAAGRYSKVLRELPLSGRVPIMETDGTPKVRVVTEFSQPLKLPPLTPGLSKVIQTVRATEAGKKLRESLKTAGAQINFDEQRENWKGVAAALAGSVSGNAKKVTVHTLKEEIRGTAKESAFVYLFDLFCRSVVKPPHNWKEFCMHLGIESAKALQDTAVLSVGRLGLKFVQMSLGENELRTQVENLFPVRCTDV